ncbi:MAG: DUF3558 domain-containing protein [Haloechinothrix sp.]
MRTPHTRTATALLAVLASAALLAGCSDEPTQGSPSPTGAQPPQQPDSALPHSGAPKVEDPIDTSGFEAEPCGVITEGQLNSVGARTRKIEPDLEGATGPSCRWSLEPIDNGSFSGAFMTANREGLSNLYSKYQSGELGFFEEMDSVRGYPAVAADLGDRRSKGYCNLEVGVRDDLTFHVGVSASFDESPNHDDPCGAARELAALAIQTMKGGA